MSKEIHVASDFDGTVTDVWRESETYTRAYSEVMANRLGFNHTELVSRLDQGLELVRGNPGIFGWEYRGLIVAPAEADPYLLTQTSASIVIRQLRQEATGLAIPTIEETGVFLDAIHYEVYPKAGIFFKDQAREYVEELHATTSFTIVTNAKTDSVRRKLATLLGEKGEEIKVLGDARKFEVEQKWTAFPEFTQPAGFPRKVYLRRQKYHDALQLIGAEVAVGDIYELDLALPEIMGLNTVLILSAHTPEHEVNYYKNHPKGSSANTLREAIEKVMKI